MEEILARKRKLLEKEIETYNDLITGENRNDLVVLLKNIKRHVQEYNDMSMGRCFDGYFRITKYIYPGIQLIKQRNKKYDVILYGISDIDMEIER